MDFSTLDVPTKERDTPTPPKGGDSTLVAGHKERILAALVAYESNPNKKIRQPKAKKTVNQRAEATYKEHTKDHYEALGYHVVTVDYWDDRMKLKHDFLGIADLIAMKAGSPPLLIQMTSKTNMAARVRKIQDSKLASLWLLTGCPIEVIGWSKNDSNRWVATVKKIEYPPKKIE